jgi:hypothetical protein
MEKVEAEERWEALGPNDGELSKIWGFFRVGYGLSRL